MTTRFRIRLASLAVASTCLFALTESASAFELLDQILNKGGAACCGAGSAKGSHTKAAPGKSSCGCCNVGTPILDAMTDLTVSVKCHLASLPRLQMPCIQMPSLDLASLLPCNRCCSGSAKGGGKTYSVPVDAGPVYHSPNEPVEAPPAPILDGEA